MKRFSLLLSVAVFAAACPAFAGELANIKVVTDANPDYTDMESMVRSETTNWKTDQEKMFAMFYWDHIARRQTAPMKVHGLECTDPIRQFNDYGYTMCSTITGIKCSIWNYMGYPCRYFDISMHTVPDVWYDGHFHHYDNSLSMMYTLPDGKTIAGVDDIGKTMAGPETNGEPVPGYIALYHALTGTSLDGYCQGADTERPLDQIVHDFTPRFLKYRYYHYGQDRGHRYTLNLRDGEVYSRFYARQDVNSPTAVELDAKGTKETYKADPAYYVPNIKGGEKDAEGPHETVDPELQNPRYHIRGNGDRTWTPLLDADHLATELYSSSNIKAGELGLQPANPNQPAEAVFKVEGANVITSLKIHALAPAAVISISTDNGLHWADVWNSDKPGDNTADLKLIKEVNGSYEVLVKVNLSAPAASVKSIAFDTITEINSKTQPSLHIGKNTVYVGNGEQTETIMVWPDFTGDHYKQLVAEEKNLKIDEVKIWHGALHPVEAGEGYVTFKVDSPTDITSVTYGGRLFNKVPKSHIDFLHSFDGGQTWKKDYTLSDNNAPWDVVHYEKVTDVPAGTHSVLFKYSLNSEANDLGGCALYNVHMEVDHKLAATVDPTRQPLEVTFNWSERQGDYKLVKRSHTQVVDSLPATYTIDVGGVDHPVVDSLTINLKGARGDIKPGYSDGKDVGGEKWYPNWATYGTNLALHKPYTVSVPSGGEYGSADKEGKKLTDGRVGSSYTGGTNYKEGLLWKRGANPEITVDLGATQKCAAFRIHTLGSPFLDAMSGEIKDKIEVLVSNDGKQFTSVGNFDTNLRFKDIPLNFMLPDDETLKGPNYFLAMKEPVEARYVKYKVTSDRQFGCTEVQVLDSFKFEPFDLKLALPDPASNGKAPPKPDVSPNAKQWKPEELPTAFGKALTFGSSTDAPPPEGKKGKKGDAPKGKKGDNAGGDAVPQ